MPEDREGAKSAKSEYEVFIAAYPKSVDCVERFLTELRRRIAKDGPHERPPGALEAFDAACTEMGTPFIKP